jgi:hypothetical protein
MSDGRVGTDNDQRYIARATSRNVKVVDGENGRRSRDEEVTAREEAIRDALHRLRAEKD